jgi:hypothetical protein
VSISRIPRFCCTAHLIRFALWEACGNRGAISSAQDRDALKASLMSLRFSLMDPGLTCSDFGIGNIFLT